MTSVMIYTVSIWMILAACFLFFLATRTLYAGDHVITRNDPDVLNRQYYWMVKLGSIGTGVFCLIIGIFLLYTHWFPL